MASSDGQLNERREVNEETEMLGNVIKMRMRVLKMGKKICLSKFENDSHCKQLFNAIDETLDKAEEEFKDDYNERVETYLNEAELLYKGFVEKLIPDDDVENTNTKLEVVKPNPRSYEITYKGDFHDVRNYLKAAQKALDSGKLDRAKKFIFKAEAISPTENAKDLLLKVEAKAEEIRKAEEAEKIGRAQETEEAPLVVTTAPEVKKEINIDTQLDSRAAAERNRCLTLVKDAVANKKFEEAERFLIKAKQSDPQLDVQEMLDKVGKAIVKQKIVVNLINTAQEAISNKEFDLASHYLSKARNNDPTIEKETQDMWNTVQKAIKVKKKHTYAETVQKTKTKMQLAENNTVKGKSKQNDALNNEQDKIIAEASQRQTKKVATKDNIPSKKEETVAETIVVKDQEDSNLDERATNSNTYLYEAEEFVNQAEDAIINEAFYLAEILLEKANHIKTNDRANELLETVKSTIKINESNKDKRDSLKKREAGRVLNMAHNKLQVKQFDKAQYLVVISESFHSTFKSKKMLQDIVTTRYTFEIVNQYKQSNKNRTKNTDVKGWTDFNEYKAERYIEIAKAAIDAKNVKLAEEYLKMSIDLNPSQEAKQMIASIRNGKRRKMGKVISFIVVGIIMISSLFIKKKYLKSKER